MGQVGCCATREKDLACCASREGDEDIWYDAEEGEPPPQQYVGSAEALSLSILPPPGPSAAPLNSWDAAEVGAWVARSVRLPQYAGRFVSQEVDGTLLSVVDDEVLSCPLISPVQKSQL